MFVNTAATFTASVRVCKPGSGFVDARSILEVLTLDVRPGDIVELTASDDDAEAAVATLAGLLTSGIDGADG